MVGINQIGLNPSAVARALGMMVFLPILAYIVGQVAKFVLGYGRDYRLIPLFSVGVEHNIPTFFSVLLLYCAVLLLMVITVLKRMEKDTDISRWAILALGFLFNNVEKNSRSNDSKA